MNIFEKKIHVLKLCFHIFFTIWGLLIDSNTYDTFEKPFHVFKLYFDMFNTSFTIYGLLTDWNTYDRYLWKTISCVKIVFWYV